jgi:hypothetical protein
VLGIARRLSASRRTVAGVSSKRPPLPATWRPGEPWTFPDHRSMASVIAAEATAA